jgi:hypothetical protein
MKLILLLVAIYSLIFYQQYKIEKANASVSGSKGSFKTEVPYQQVDLPDKDGNGNAGKLMKSYYSVYRYPTAREPAMTAFSFGE